MPSLFWFRDGMGGVTPSIADDIKAPLDRRDKAHWIVSEQKITKEEFDTLSLDQLAAKYPFISNKG